jgi:hypothetical protein
VSTHTVGARTPLTSHPQRTERPKVKIIELLMVACVFDEIPAHARAGSIAGFSYKKTLANATREQM